MALARAQRQAAAVPEIAAVPAVRAVEVPAAMAARRLPWFCCSRPLKHCQTALTILRSQGQVERLETAASEPFLPHRQKPASRAAPGKRTLLPPLARDAAPKSRRPKTVNEPRRSGATIHRGAASMTGKNRLRSCVNALLLLAVCAAVANAQQYTCPGSPASGAGSDFHSQSLTNSNFAHQSLRNTNFQNAVLTAPVFTGADLTGANFS